MNLKEAFTYLNFLKSLTETLEPLLTTASYVYKIKRTTKNSAVDSTQPDETTEVVAVRNFDADETKLYQTFARINQERVLCTLAIAAAKHKLVEKGIDIDSLIATNKILECEIKAYKTLAGVKSKEVNAETTAYRFNNEGNQVAYRIPVTDVYTIDYDRNDVKQKLRTTKSQFMHNSNTVDRAMLDTQLNFVSQWDLTDTLEDIIAEG